VWDKTSPGSLIRAEGHQFKADYPPGIRGSNKREILDHEEVRGAIGGYKRERIRNYKKL